LRDERSQRVLKTGYRFMRRLWEAGGEGRNSFMKWKVGPKGNNLMNERYQRVCVDSFYYRGASKKRENHPLQYL